jgi:hypothetical protein
MDNLILDDCPRECQNDPDCPNPTLLTRFFEEPNSLSDKDFNILKYYLDECDKCKTVWKEKELLIRNKSFQYDK